MEPPTADPLIERLKFAMNPLKYSEAAMDKEILKQLVRGAIEGSELPALSKEETELYVSHLRTRGIIAKVTYWHREGREALAFFKITHTTPEIHAAIDRILKE
jgi:hypothetical protein